MRATVALFTLVSTVSAQANWFALPLAASPPPRDTHAMCTEPLSGRVILFGGVVNDVTQYNDTWEFGTSAWLQAQPTSAPSPRESHWMAPDGQGAVILFGGHAFQGGGTLNDTWRYFQGQWTQLSPSTVPPPRRYHRMVFTGQSIVMFGGFYGSGATGNRSDTWEWIAGNWVQRFPATVPLARHGQGFAYDFARSRVVMFGGHCQGNQWPQDTWEWDGNNWIAMAPAHPPTDASWMDFDPIAGRVVSYGGWITSGTFPAIGESWTWDGSDWSQLVLGSPNPGLRRSPIAWSPLSGGLMVYGGHAPTNETWVQSSSGSAASYVQFGTGCVGPASMTPSLLGVPGETPRIGSTSRIRVSNLPLAVTVPIFVLGLSNTQDPGPPPYSLPVDLGILGWPGCSQLVSDDVVYFAITTTGQADYAMTVPMNLGLVGFTFHAQALVLYSGGGVAVSNGVTGVVGY